MAYSIKGSCRVVTICLVIVFGISVIGNIVITWRWDNRLIFALARNAVKTRIPPTSAVPMKIPLTPTLPKKIPLTPTVPKKLPLTPAVPMKIPLTPAVPKKIPLTRAVPKKIHLTPAVPKKIPLVPAVPMNIPLVPAVAMKIPPKIAAPMQIAPQNTMAQQIHLENTWRGRIVYEKCEHIPESNQGKPWPEQLYLNDPRITNLSDMADPVQSKAWIEGDGNVTVGEAVTLKIQLVDGHGKRKTIGGDLLRVWISEPRLQAAAVANVTDHNNGTYSVTVTPLWSGQPSIQIAIIAPREMTAFTLKRRYTCPPVWMNAAVFVRGYSFEETPCNFYPQIVPRGYELCNLTAANNGRPWYCGKPRMIGLTCNHWDKTFGWALFNEMDETNIQNEQERTFMTSRYSCMMFPSNLRINVTAPHDTGSLRLPPQKCNSANRTHTWSSASPTGYLYNRKWIRRHCERPAGGMDPKCLENTQLIIIGDSTSRQIFESVHRKMPCQKRVNLVSATGKVAEEACVNNETKFSLSLYPHELPICSDRIKRQHLVSFQSHLDAVSDNGYSKTILVLHVYAHTLQYHSHVGLQLYKSIKDGIVRLLKRKPNVFIVVKGPHTFSFAQVKANQMWFPSIYAEYHSEMMRQVFQDISDRVIYLDMYDITLVTKQWHIHAEDYIIDEMRDTMFSYICPY